MNLDLILEQVFHSSNVLCIDDRSLDKMNLDLILEQVFHSSNVLCIDDRSLDKMNDQSKQLFVCMAKF